MIPDRSRNNKRRRFPWRRILAALRQLADLARIGWGIWHMNGHAR